MTVTFTPENREQIRKSIQGEYAKAAASPQGLFAYPTGRAGLEGLDYAPEIFQALAETVLASYCGVGNPFKLGQIYQGEAVLDIGSGAGVDVFVAAILVGPSGRAVGVDLTAEMLTRAERNLRALQLENVNFQQASGEYLPFRHESFDAVISNGVFNLIPDKAKALSEVLRVLKPQGRLMLADQVLTGELPKNVKSRVASWAK